MSSGWQQYFKVVYFEGIELFTFGPGYGIKLGVKCEIQNIKKI
jgi:hypothetical protein